VVGDPVYGKHGGNVTGQEAKVIELLHEFRRQALHAERLGLHHPETKERLEWTAPVPNDMRTLLTALEEDSLS
jgi:23S rRNA pseudouridine1911/1915/1917 synthase